MVKLMYLLLFKQIPCEGQQLYQFFTDHHISLSNIESRHSSEKKKQFILELRHATRPSSFIVTGPK